MSKRRSITDLLQQVKNIERKKEKSMLVEDFKRILNQIIKQYGAYSDCTWEKYHSHPFELRSMYRDSEGVRINILKTHSVENGIYSFCRLISKVILSWEQMEKNPHQHHSNYSNDELVGMHDKNIALRIIHLEDFEIPEKHRIYYEIEFADQRLVYIGGHSTNCSGSGREGANKLDFVFHSLAYILGTVVHHVVIPMEVVKTKSHSNSDYIF